MFNINFLKEKRLLNMGNSTYNSQKSLLFTKYSLTIRTNTKRRLNPISRTNNTVTIILNTRSALITALSTKNNFKVISNRTAYIINTNIANINISTRTLTNA